LQQHFGCTAQRDVFEPEKSVARLRIAPAFFHLAALDAHGVIAVDGFLALLRHANLEAQ
jgi:hypothetical protein